MKHTNFLKVPDNIKHLIFSTNGITTTLATSLEEAQDMLAYLSDLCHALYHDIDAELQRQSDAECIINGVPPQLPDKPPVWYDSSIQDVMSIGESIFTAFDTKKGGLS